MILQSFYTSFLFFRCILSTILFMDSIIRIIFTNEKKTVSAPAGTRLLDVMRAEGILIDAPCGGRGTCGKCLVSVDGVSNVRACRTFPVKDIVVDTAKALKPDTSASAGQEDAAGSCLRGEKKPKLSENVSARRNREKYAAAFDIGTTTAAGYLLRVSDGGTAALSGCTNPQVSFGADVISRISEAVTNVTGALTSCIRSAVNDLLSGMTEEAGCSPEEVREIVIVGNPCMHHLFLGISPASLAAAPYHPAVYEALVRNAADLDLHAAPDCSVYFPPNIAGFVGGDTVACMTALRPDLGEGWTLLLDIGTNGEIVLGCRDRIIACSAAAGPAFEGAGISCGMRGSAGAISHVRLLDGRWELETVGGQKPVGICGSGLLDAAAWLLRSGQMDETGLLLDEGPVLLADGSQSGNGKAICLTQKDIRQLQLAKGAICAAVLLLCEHAGISPGQIQSVLLAGAFGSFLSPDSACRIGLIPQELSGRVRAVGNAAGTGACMMALDPEKRQAAQMLASRTEYVELASLPQFQDVFVESMEFPVIPDETLTFEELKKRSEAFGFTHCARMDVSSLRLLKEVREMCAKNTCGQYGRTWVCPPGLGTLKECEKRIRRFRHGLLLQTVGALEDPFDYDSMALLKERHGKNFDAMYADLSADHPDLLALGAGGCSRCEACTYPDAPCRFPQQAYGSMEGYGLLVTEVCRQNGLKYYYGPNTIAYTSCFLY